MNGTNDAAAPVQGRRTARTRASGETTGSPRRRAQRVTEAVLIYDLGRVLDDLRADRGWPPGEPNTVTLVKEPGLRVVVVALRAGARIKEHRAPAGLTVQTLVGHTSVRVPAGVVDLPRGHLVALEPDLAHDLAALEDSAVLLTIAWPVGDGAAGDDPADDASASRDGGRR
jgi:quercetin dioxygenase-like cupin family protein